MPATTEHEPPLIDQLAELAGADTNTIVRKITDRVLLVDLTVRRWEGRHQIDGAELTMHGRKLPKKLTARSHWVLMPEGWSRRFNEVTTHIRNLMHPKVQPRRGVDIVSLKDAPRIFKAIKDYRQSTFEPAVDEFVDAWPGLADEIHPDLVKHYLAEGLDAADAAHAADAVYRQLARYVPTRPALRAKFAVLLDVIPLGGGGPTGAGALEGEQAEEFLRELERGTQNFARQVFMGIMQQPLEEAAEVAKSIADKAAAGKGGLREESLGVLRRALEKVKSFSDFVARPALLDAIAAAEIKLADYSHDELNQALRSGTRLGEDLGKVFAAVGAEVHDAQATVAKFGRKFRQIEI